MENLESKKGPNLGDTLKMGFKLYFNPDKNKSVLKYPGKDSKRIPLCDPSLQHFETQFNLWHKDGFFCASIPGNSKEFKDPDLLEVLKMVQKEKLPQKKGKKGAH